MDAVTYPDQRVRRELDEHWLTTRLDVSTHGSAAAQFELSGIPTAIAVSPTGEILGRVLGFAEAGPLAKELSRLRRQ